MVKFILATYHMPAGARQFLNELTVFDIHSCY